MEVKVGQNIYVIMEPQPLRSVPPSGSGEEGGGGGGSSGSSGAHMRGEEEPMVVTEGKKKILNEESPLIKVDFGNCAQNLLDKNGNSVLTPAQYFEFQRQSLIFEHMKAGLPVPLHLWSPIWKKVANSDRGGIYKQYSSFVGSGPTNVDDRKKCRRTDGNNWKVDQRYMMDPEPGRCRRTDGNKWRCKKDAVPDQKYCERHMHRGSQRSRKHVELFQIANPWDTTSPKNLENLKTISTHSQNNPLPQSPSPLTFLPPSDSKNSKTNPTLSQLINPSSSNTSNIPNSKDGNKIDSTFLGERKGYTLVGDGINSSITINAANNATPAVTISTPIMPNTAANNSNNVVIDFVNSATRPISSSNPTTHSIPGSGCSFTTTNTHTANINNKNNNNEGIGQKREGGSFTSLKNMIIGSSTSGNNAIVGNSVSTGFRFSPKSVLQVLGCRGSCSYRSDIELELGRCRRTDGKKWRCSRVVVPDHKYCEKHMHRGAKKRLEVLHPVANLTTVPASPCTPCTMSTTRKADSAATSTSTNLSISVPTGPQFLTNDVKSPTSCSSDATISDTAITANENSNFSS